MTVNLHTSFNKTRAFRTWFCKSLEVGNDHCLSIAKSNSALVCPGFLYSQLSNSKSLVRARSKSGAGLLDLMSMD
jgi:hypothetical protein